MPPRRRKRLDPAAFNLPVEQIRQGFYSDTYFVRAREIVRQDKRAPAVTMQFSGKTEGWVSGIDEAIAILKLCVDDWSALTVHALYEGDRYENWDTVLTVEGPYEAFGYLETLCLGTLARRTRICTNAKLHLRRGGVQAGDGLRRARRRALDAARRRLQRAWSAA